MNKIENSKTKMGRLDRFSYFMTKHRILVFVLICVLTVGFAVGASRIKGEVILQDMFPHGHAYLKLHERFSEVFGSGGSGVVIAIKAKKGDIFEKDILTKIKKMTDEISMWDEVYRTLTFSIASRAAKTVKAKAKGEISIESLMWPDVPQTSQYIELLKKQIFSDQAYKGILVSTDGSAALIMTEFKENISYEKSFSLLRTLVKQYTNENISVHVVGYPVLMGWIYNLKHPRDCHSTVYDFS